MKIITGCLVAFGALAFNIWGFLNACNEAKKTSKKEKFDWIKSFITVIPSLVAGFLAGFAMDPNSAVEYISLITSGFGIAAAQGNLGINNFFDEE